VSVFALFHTTVFWSYMADTFNKEQAKRLFATIATGMFAGSQMGPLITVLFVDVVGSAALTLVAAIMLLIPVPMILYLARLKVTELHNENLNADLSAARIGGKPLAGFKYFFADPYLLAIGVFILLYTMISSFIYFEQVHVLEPYDRDTRTQILGSISLLGNSLQYVLAFFVTGRIVRNFGMGAALSSMPVLVIAGMTVLAFSPIITVLLALQLVRQAGNYAITQPARHMLFTEVDQETRFKTKPVTDIAVYRGGDMITAWFFTGLTEGLGLAFTVVGLIGAAIAAVWAGTGLYLGKAYDRRRSRQAVHREATAGDLADQRAARQAHQ
jgi:AAA family ATP:ADP antiporter